ncbi:MAG: response regulator [Reichenbachiella sp.]|uniref:response regulator n=1 Tax=Reichenbachiella sp. TaxID=2184521 RepID=UPI003296E670
MEKLYIICVEDQKEVLNTIADQLSYFENQFTIEECETADEAYDLINTIDQKGDKVAVVVSDHVMPGTTGVDFFVKMKLEDRFAGVKKILLTGQATHTDTINAINKAKIDNYIEKPWTKGELIEKVSKLLTRFIIESGIAYEPYTEVLDKQTLFDLLKVR